MHCLSGERFKLGSLYLVREKPGEYKSFRMVEGAIFEDCCFLFYKLKKGNFGNSEYLQIRAGYHSQCLE